MQEMTIETALTLLAIFTPLNLYLWFGVGLGTFQLHSKPKKVSEGKPDPLKTSATGLIFNHRADIITRRTDMTQAELERIAETILKHTTPDEMQEYLAMDHDDKLLWIKYKIASLEVQA
ncbi:hypothetical protein [Streptococcus suis]|uniref:hypothetical protein n=1 Tax=Streptococcus suis TaxID=1307 RepID=UPI00211E81CA